MKGCKKAFALAGLLGLGFVAAPAALAAEAVHDAAAKARGNMNMALGQAAPSTAYRSYSIAPTTERVAPAAATNAGPRSYSFAPVASQAAPVYRAYSYAPARHSLGHHDAGAKVRGDFGL